MKLNKKIIENNANKIQNQKKYNNEFAKYDESQFASLVESIIINKESVVLVTKFGRKVEI